MSKKKHKARIILILVLTFFLFLKMAQKLGFYIQGEKNEKNKRENIRNAFY
jgi:hypothetical protein